MMMIMMMMTMMMMIVMLLMMIMMMLMLMMMTLLMMIINSFFLKTYFFSHGALYAWNIPEQLTLLDALSKCQIQYNNTIQFIVNYFDKMNVVLTTDHCHDH